jgi:hypothetical protein
MLPISILYYLKTRVSYTTGSVLLRDAVFYVESAEIQRGLAIGLVEVPFKVVVYHLNSKIRLLSNPIAKEHLTNEMVCASDRVACELIFLPVFLLFGNTQQLCIS